jgi:hypothetical protein
MSKRTFSAFLDRREGDMAVLLLGDDQRHTVAVPMAFLPSDVKEGTVLTVTVAVDEDATESARARVSSLLDELMGQ